MENLEEVNALIAREYQKLFEPSARYHYYEDAKGNRYFYTQDKINHKEKPRYVAGIYRYIKTKNHYKLIKQVGFAKKKKAKQWANDNCYRNKIQTV